MLHLLSPPHPLPNSSPYIPGGSLTYSFFWAGDPPKIVTYILGGPPQKTMVSEVGMLDLQGHCCLGRPTRLCNWFDR